jgi:inner membrane protein
MKTGGNAEFLVIGAAVLLLVISLNLDNRGGLKTVATEKLNLKDKETPMIYNQNASKAFIWADFQGYKAGDRQPINGKFLVISEESGYVLMSEDKGVYRVGSDVIEEKIKINVGNSAEITQVSQSFDDVEVSGVLQQIRADYSNDLVLLSGSLDVDYAEKIKGSSSIKVSGSKVTLDFADLDEAIAALSDQWAIGELTLKVFKPNPWIVK